MDVEVMSRRSVLVMQVLGWKAKLDVKDMCRDQWAWATKHPKGFED